MTLREAIDAANTNTAVTADVAAGSDTAADTITFDVAALQAEAGAGNPLVITLAGTELTISDDLEITGPGPDVLTIDANGLSRAIRVTSDARVVLSGLTVTGGNADHGGGVYNLATLTLVDVAIIGNDASSGGGVYNNDEATLNVTDAIVSGNTASSGGGIENNYGTLALTGVTVTGNSGNGGGGISSSGATTLVDTTVSGNDATILGGGIAAMEDICVLVNSQVTGNAAREGGGLYVAVAYPVVKLINTTLSGNTAAWGGGLASRGRTSLANVLISGNAAIGADDVSGRGGGIWKLGTSRMELTNVTVTANTARDAGGGLFGRGTASAVNNTIIALNTVGDAGEDVSGSIVASNNLIGTDPGFLDPISADYRLAADSPAIDAGDSALLPADTYDLDGDGDTAEPLPVDLAGKPRVVGAQVDIGAYEYRPAKPAAAAAGDVDLDDFVLLKQNFGTTTGATWAMGDFDGNGAVDLDDFVILKQNFGTAAPAANVTADLLATGEVDAVRIRPQRLRRRTRDNQAARAVLDILVAARLAALGA